MAKRAERRHHESRIKQKFREVATRWAGRYDSWVVKYKWVRDANGKLIQVLTYLDRTGFTKRLQYIDRQAVRLAHHNKCTCGGCRNADYKREQRRPLHKMIEDDNAD